MRELEPLVRRSVIKGEQTKYEHQATCDESIELVITVMLI